MVEQVPDAFVQQVLLIQEQVVDDLINYLSDLKKAGGKIESIPANIEYALKMRGQVAKYLRKHGFYDKIVDFGNDMDLLAQLSRDYYRSMGLRGSFYDADLETLSQLKKSALVYMNDADAKYIDTVYNSVISSVYKKRSFRDLEKDLIKLSVGGDENVGFLKRYTSTHAFDSYAQFDRHIQNIKASQLGIGLYLYSGGLIVDSREFCKARAGRVFDDKTIDSWNDMQWSGKNTRVDVRVGLGGFNCTHILSPVTAEYAKELGYKSE